MPNNPFGPGPGSGQPPPGQPPPGQPPQSPYAPPAYPAQPQAYGQPAYAASGLKPHRGNAVLVLGICGLVVCGVCGIIAWVMGNQDIAVVAFILLFALGMAVESQNSLFITPW